MVTAKTTIGVVKRRMGELGFSNNNTIRAMPTCVSRARRTVFARTQFLRVVVGAAIAGCISERAPLEPSYRDDIGPLVAARCASCHSGEAPAGGLGLGSYLDLIGCANGQPLTVGGDPKLLRALDGPSHASVRDTRDVLARWLARGAPASNGGVHPASFVDPRSAARHGKFLRDRRWKPMLDATNADACGKCHAGAAASAASAAPGATTCTTCHRESVLACNTCHGAAKAYPPRDACFFPTESGGAHAAHVEPSASTPAGVPCASCHPVPTVGLPGGTHGDGAVQVYLAGGSFDAATKACTTACHAGIGALRPTPKWTDEVKCGDCHSVPPPAHPAGTCANCHSPLLHANGRVDLGDGSGKCGACHGTGDDPRPKTAAHAKHAFDCSTCHATDSKHPNGELSVRLLGLAAKGGRSPVYDPASKSCGSTYCHDLGGGTNRTPKWSETISGCNSCHSSPPPPPHTASAACGTAGCHLDVVGKHVNGAIDL